MEDNYIIMLSKGPILGQKTIDQERTLYRVGFTKVRNEWVQQW